MAVQRGNGPGRNDLSGARGQKKRSERTSTPTGSRVEPSHVKEKARTSTKKTAIKPAEKPAAKKTAKKPAASDKGR